MKEEGDWSSEKRTPHGSSKFGGRSIIPDWASLPPELVERIADLALSTDGGVGAYMDMRAVCSSWRSAVAKPSPLTTVADLRFRPRHWVMLDLQPDDKHGDDRLFLHIPTGRFRRLHLPVLRDNFVAGATDGLLVLGDMYPPHLARVLNPFTGDMLHFTPALPQHFRYTSVDGGSHSTLFLLRWGKLIWAAPNSVSFTMKYIERYLVSIVYFQGDVYCADACGRVFKLEMTEGDDSQGDDSEADDNDELVVIAEVSPDGYDSEGSDSEMCSYLVESAGELLLVRHVDQTLKVFRVDVKHKLLEEVKSLSGRTLFLGKERCVSVYAGKLPSVDGDCIYLLDCKDMSMLDFEDECDMCLDLGYKCNMCVDLGYKYSMRVYNLRGDMVDIISDKDFRARPFSLVQVLLRYCDVLPKL